jgi:hypothetical protein
MPVRQAHAEDMHHLTYALLRTTRKVSVLVYQVHASPTLIDFIYRTAQDINIRGRTLYEWWLENKRE